MKNYRFLAKNELVLDGDELQCDDENGEIYYTKAIVKKSQPRLANDYSCKIRRPIPYTGRVAFLVNYSPMIRVEVDCTGLTEEEICQKISEEAKHKLWLNYKEYLDNFNDNIDWDNTKEDTECPAQLTLPTCCNHENEYGKRDYWDVFNVGNQGRIRLQVQRIDKPIGHDPLESDEIAWRLAKLAGYDLDTNGYICGFPYRKGECCRDF